MIQLKFQGEGGWKKRKKYKEDWKGKKKLSRATGPKSMTSQLPPKILTLPVKKPVIDPSSNSCNRLRSSTIPLERTRENLC